MRCSVVVLLFSIVLSSHAADIRSVVALDLFAEAYDLGTAAVKARDWTEANSYFAVALKALGDNDHPKKEVAEILLKKGREFVQGQRQYDIAEELFRLRQWKEAEEAYVRAAKWSGMTAEMQVSINAARKAAREEVGLPPIVEQRNKAEQQFRLLGMNVRMAIMDRDFKAARQGYGELDRLAKMYGFQIDDGLHRLRAEFQKMENEKNEALAEQKDGDF